MLEQETPNIASMASLPTLSAPGLLVMDVDSTLIDEEVIDELGVAAGVGEQIASVTARAMNGELDFREALRARVALLKGLPTTIFDEVYHRVHFTHGALELIDTLHAHDWKVGVVSGGFHEVVDRLAADAHLDYWIANRLEAADGRLTGHVLGDIVTKDTKLESLRAWAARMGIDMAQTVAVGDGANDLPMQAGGWSLTWQGIAAVTGFGGRGCWMTWSPWRPASGSGPSRCCTRCPRRSSWRRAGR